MYRCTDVCPFHAPGPCLQFVQFVRIGFLKVSNSAVELIVNLLMFVNKKCNSAEITWVTWFLKKLFKIDDSMD